MSLKRLLILSILIASELQITPAQILDVLIQNISITKGQLCIAIFTDEACFRVEKTVWNTKCPKTQVVDGKLELKIAIKPGKYGVSVLDDKNLNGKMEYNLFGIPREGFGFSNYCQRGIFRPAFDDFSFQIEPNEIKTVRVQMKYF